MKKYSKNQIYVTNRKEWRKWLKENHDKYSDIWLVYYKKESGKERIPYSAAVEEALCFGWIDSIIKRIDDAKYMQKFTPRKSNSQWSEINKKRANNLIRQGKMSEAGLEKIASAKRSGIWNKSVSKPVIGNISEELEKALNKNKKAKQFYDNLTTTYKKQYIGWIVTAKKKETREKRINEAIKYLENKQKLGLK